jgi:glutamate-1-semialdehyde aminotransferase/spore coat polysaccharide biosynthesis protein SpsF (cytidylyltransferase family)
VLVAIIQARMGSTRFPGKALMGIGGRPMLGRVVDRVPIASDAAGINKIVVATTVTSSDDPIVEFCTKENILCFRGDEADVLDRFYRAAKAHSADAVVRITADCPLLDPELIKKIIARFQVGDCDYVSNTLRYTYPDGLDAEAFSFAALERAWHEAKKPSDREHVTPYLRGNNFRIANVESATPVSPNQFRWTVDDSRDLEFVRAVYAALAPCTKFGSAEVFALLKARPDLATAQNAISNRGYYQSLYQEATAGAAPKRTLTQSESWLARSKKVIPGSAQTFSKSHKQYVRGAAPMFLQRGKGCRVWDVDDNQYIDYVQGLLPNILGYANDQVNDAVTEQLAEGHSFSLPHPVEVKLAERLTDLIPCAEMVRFGKNGSDATSGAVRAARAYTSRDRIACCGYHGWQDWYIGSTTRNAGVPKAVRDLTHPFHYNDLTSLEKVLTSHPGEFAAVIMEPVNFEEPIGDFLNKVCDLAHKHGALLIFDEICSGFHFGLGGAQKIFGVTPDLACFGKAMGNGFPISCVVGRADVMSVFDEIFFSFTFAGEVASMAAAMKVIDILEQTTALADMESHGRVLQDGVNAMAAEAGLASRIQCVGRPQWSLMKFQDKCGNEDRLLKNLFQQEAVKRGVLLLVTHDLCAAHDHIAVRETLEIYASVLKTLAAWIAEPDPARHLEGEMSEPVFRVR